MGAPPRRPRLDLRRLFCGSALVAAEVAGSTVVLTVIQMALFTFGHIMVLSSPEVSLDISTRWLMLGLAPFALIILNAASVTIQSPPEDAMPAIYNAVKIQSSQKGVEINLTGEVQQHLGGGRGAIPRRLREQLQD